MVLLEGTIWKYLPLLHQHFQEFIHTGLRIPVNLGCLRLQIRSCVGVCSSSESVAEERWISLSVNSDHRTFFCSCRRSCLPSGSWSSRTLPPWQPRRSRPCRAPPLRSWIRRRSFLKRRLWMRSERRCRSLDRDVFRFPSNRNRISVAPPKLHPPMWFFRLYCAQAEGGRWSSVWRLWWLKRPLYLSTVIVLILMAIYST